MSKTIRIDDETEAFLDANGNTGDSYGTVIKKVIAHFKTSGGIVQ